MTLSHSARTRWVIALLMLFTAINFADKSIIGLVAAPMMADLGLTVTEYGAISSAFYLLFSISAVVFGFLGNRVPGRWLLVGLAVVWSVAQLPVAIPAAGFGVLLATRILLGAGEGPGVPLGMHVAFTWVAEHKRAFTAALLTVGSGLGVIVGAPLLNALIEVAGWRSPFLVLGVTGLIWVVAWLLIGGDGPYSVASPAADAAVAAEPRIPYRRLLTTGTWLGTLFSGFAVYWGLVLGISYLPLYLTEVAGYSRSSIGFLASLPAYVSIVFMLGGGALAGRLLRRGTSRRLAQGVLGGVFALVSGLSMILLTRVDGGATMLILPLIALGFGIGNAQTPLSQAAVADTVPARQRGAALGVWYAVVSIASIIAPVLSGAIVDAAGDRATGFGIVFDLAGVLAVLGGLVAMVTVRPDRDAARLGLGGAETSPAAAGRA